MMLGFWLCSVFFVMFGDVLVFCDVLVRALVLFFIFFVLALIFVLVLVLVWYLFLLSLLFVPAPPPFPVAPPLYFKHAHSLMITPPPPPTPLDGNMTLLSPPLSPLHPIPRSSHPVTSCADAMTPRRVINATGTPGSGTQGVGSGGGGGAGGASGLTTEQRAVAVARCMSAGEGCRSELRSKAVLALANAACFPFSEGLRELVQVGVALVWFRLVGLSSQVVSWLANLLELLVSQLVG